MTALSEKIKKVTKKTEWEQRDDILVLYTDFSDFVAAWTFLSRVAELAEQHSHHPEIHNVYNEVTLTLTTHDAGELTEKDVVLAEEIHDILTVEHSL